jgi:hypothetical protein
VVSEYPVMKHCKFGAVVTFQSLHLAREERIVMVLNCCVSFGRGGGGGEGNASLLQIVPGGFPLLSHGDLHSVAFRGSILSLC